MNEIVEINAQIAPCPNCEEPILILNGTIQRPDRGRIVLWTKDETPQITAHHRLCKVIGNGVPVVRSAAS